MAVNGSENPVSVATAAPVPSSWPRSAEPVSSWASSCRAGFVSAGGAAPVVDAVASPESRPASMAVKPLAAAAPGVSAGPGPNGSSGPEAAPVAVLGAPVADLGAPVADLGAGPAGPAGLPVVGPGSAKPPVPAVLCGPGAGIAWVGS